MKFEFWFDFDPTTAVPKTTEYTEHITHFCVHRTC